MSSSKMPVVFAGHGSPMLALENNELTRTLESLGKTITEKHGRPKAILAISGHWFTDGTWIQSAEKPEQIYDMYGFPPELYAVRYPVSGSNALTSRVQTLLAGLVKVNDSWGIDHGTWTILIHMFPEADIPVVQLSVNRLLSPAQSYALGKMLEPLREEGYLIFGSGNVVHNLYLLNPQMREAGTPQTIRFTRFINDCILSGSHESLVQFMNHPDAAYASPTPDHFYPLLYCAGAGQGDPVTVFNDVFRSGTVAMTSYVFGLES